MSRSDRDEWPFTEPPETPPFSLDAALATPLRDLAGCWIEGCCEACSTHTWTPIRMLLTERHERAGLPLRRAVEALLKCDKCHRWGIDVALVSDSHWRESKVAGKAPNWSMVLSGSRRGTVAFTAPPFDIR